MYTHLLKTLFKHLNYMLCFKIFLFVSFSTKMAEKSLRNQGNQGFSKTNI